MPKPNLGKTDTIKERAIYVYLPALETAEEWKAKAKKAGVSISKFVADRVGDSIMREEGDEQAYLTRIDLIKKLNDAEGEIKEVKEENRLLKNLVENLDRELKRYRAKPFVEEGFQGVRRFDKELMEFLRKGGSFNEREILSQLNIEPNDTELVKAIDKQLEALEGYGLVEYSGRGWKWKG